MKRVFDIQWKHKQVKLKSKYCFISVVHSAEDDGKSVSGMGAYST